MFSWFKKPSTTGPSAVERLKVDIHSHLIPGIDDGAKTLEESLTLVKAMVEMGYEKLILTPHVMRDVYRNTPERILEGLAQLQEAVTQAGINVILEASAEYYLDEGFLKILETESVLPIAGKYLLFETSYMAKPNNMFDLIYAIKLHGYTPILAHPERYRYIKAPEEEYQALRAMDVLFQIDMTSWGGHYGKDAKTKAEFLLQKGWVDLVGSDVHKMRHINNLQSVLDDRTLWKRVWEKNSPGNIALLDSVQEATE